jgi:hypothetical protein
MYNAGMTADKINIDHKQPKRTHVYLIIVLISASLATLISTLIIYQNSLRAAEEALKLQALGIAASLEPSLVDVKGKENIFRDIITETSWEGIAFIALYDRNGVTLLHSNENLVGHRDKQSAFDSLHCAQILSNFRSPCPALYFWETE